MLSSYDLTETPLDITEQWCRATGECRGRVTAYMRAGAIATVAVRDGGTCIMCRNAVIAILSPEVIRSIEAVAVVRPAS